MWFCCRRGGSFVSRKAHTEKQPAAGEAGHGTAKQKETKNKKATNQQVK
jgi:hypothetical protein